MTAEIGRRVRYTKPDSAVSGLEATVIEFNMRADYAARFICLRFDGGAEMLAERKYVVFLDEDELLKELLS